MKNKTLLACNAWQIFLIFLFFSAFPIVYFFFNSLPFVVFKILTMLNMVFVLIWLYIVGVNLFKKNSKKEKNLKLFKMVVFFGICLLIFWPFFGTYKDPKFIILINISIFYTFVVVAKGIVSEEQKKHVHFSEIASLVTQMLLFPIGIWYLQPRIKRIFFTAT